MAQAKEFNPIYFDPASKSSRFTATPLLWSRPYSTKLSTEWRTLSPSTPCLSARLLNPILLQRTPAFFNVFEQNSPFGRANSGAYAHVQNTGPFDKRIPPPEQAGICRYGNNLQTGMAGHGGNTGFERHLLTRQGACSLGENNNLAVVRNGLVRPGQQQACLLS